MSAEAMGWVFRHSPYRGDTRLVHLAIADVVNDMHDNRFWMSVRELALKARVTPRTVQRALKKMVDDGYLEVIVPAAHHEPTVYRFVVKLGVTTGRPSDEVGVTSTTSNGAGGLSVERTQALVPSVPDGTTPIDGDAYSKAFLAAWETYPRKIAKKAAWRAWKATVRREGPAVRDQLVAASKNYSDATRDRAVEHIMHGSTFYGPDERWRDYVTPAKARAAATSEESWMRRTMGDR